MSYDLGLYYGDTPAKVTRHSEGGTYALGGVDVAELNITYNYGRHYFAELDGEHGIRWLYGLKASDTVSALEVAIHALGTDRDPDYWKPTPGNAGYALSILLGVTVIVAYFVFAA